MNSLTLDWFWLYLQLIILIAVIGRELIRPHGRNLYAILIPGTMLILVQGQAWWVLSEFDQNNAADMQHMLQTISLYGARLANFYIGLSIICFGITYSLFAPRKRSAAARAPTQMQYRATPFIPDMLAAVWTLVSAGMLLRTAGGLQSLIAKPGQATGGGLMMFLMMTGLGKLLLLHKVAFRQRINCSDLALFALVFILFLINARFMAAFILLQLALLLNYCRHEVSRRGLVSLAFVMFLVFIVFGLYRDYTAYSHQVEWDTLRQFFMTHTGQNNALEWFYRTNVEGFAGLAGILTFAENHGGIAHDFGLSNLAVITSLIPYAIRNDPILPFRELADTLESLLPYHGSVVPGGMENAYAHFGLLGVLGFGVLLGYLTRRLHAQMLNPKADRLLVALLSVWFLQTIRGSFGGSILLGLAEVFMLWVYRLMRAIDLKATGSGP